MSSNQSLSDNASRVPSVLGYEGENSTSYNESDHFYFGSAEDVFRYSHVRNSLVAAYSIVFLCCFFGNLIVITVICLHRRMRTATNFFLANLAFADVCVGIFCVYQNLLLYLTSSWALGDFLCRMYHFVHGLSYTASILILIVISVERYVVIVHTLWGRRFITLKRLKIVLGLVWTLSAIYNSPRLFVYGTVQVPSMSEDDGMDTLCVLKRSYYNNKNYDLYNFVILFAIPVLIMIILYIIIGSKLWKSGESFRVKRNKDQTCVRTNSIREPVLKQEKPIAISRPANVPSSNFIFLDKPAKDREEYTEEPRRFGSKRNPVEEQTDLNGKNESSTNVQIEQAPLYENDEDWECVDNNNETESKNSSKKYPAFHFAKSWRVRRGFFCSRKQLSRNALTSSTSASNGQRTFKEKKGKSVSMDLGVFRSRFNNMKRFRSSMSLNSDKRKRGDWSTGTRVLRMRRRIIRLLVVIVVCFVACNLPYHARKFWQNWSSSYDGTKPSSIFFTIATTLVFYMNSGINPFLYAFLSKNFRQCIADVFLCRKRRWNLQDLSPLSTGRKGSSERSNRPEFKQNSV